MTKTGWLVATIGMLAVIGAGSVGAVTVLADAADRGTVAAAPEADGKASCVVPDPSSSDSKWIVAPEAQRAKDVIDAELKERFGEGSEQTGPRERLERGLIGVANDHHAQQIVVVTDPAAEEIDEAALEDELQRLTSDHQQSHPDTEALDVRVQEGCHPAADLIEAYNVLRARDWHPQADELRGATSLSSYDSTYHVDLPTNAREVGEALQAKLGPVVTINYTDDLPQQAPEAH